MDKIRIKMSNRLKVVGVPEQTLHKNLLSLDYENSGHIGFASEKALVETQKKLQENINSVEKELEVSKIESNDKLNQTKLELTEEINNNNLEINKKLDENISETNKVIENISKEVDSSKQLAKDAKDIAEGKSKAYVFENFELMKHDLKLSDETKYEIGDNLLIKDETSSAYWISNILTDNFGEYGYYEISRLNRGKLDLAEYQTIIDESLHTNSKNIAQAINEVNKKIIDEITRAIEKETSLEELSSEERINSLARTIVNSILESTNILSRISNLENSKIKPNPELVGNEEDLTSIEIENVKYKLAIPDEDENTTAEQVYFNDGQTLAEKYINGELGGGGGGGSSDDEIILTYITPSNINLATNEVISIEYNFERDLYKNRTGIEKVYIDTVLKSAKNINQGNNVVNISNLTPGFHEVVIEVTSGSIQSSIFYTLEVIDLSISSKFDSFKIYSKDITYTYTPNGNVEKTVYFIIDNKEPITIIVNESGKTMTYDLRNLSHGSHSLKVYMTAYINETLITSNTLEYDLLVNNNGSTPIISCLFNTKEAVEGELLSFEYLVFTPDVNTSDVNLLINDEVVKELTVDRTKKVWNIREYPIGETTFTIQTGEIFKSFMVNVSESDIKIEAVTRNSELYLTSKNRLNTEAPNEREIWENNGVQAIFNNFNWTSNGWKQDNDGDSVLRVNGDATVVIPFKVFENDFKPIGKTIEFEFSTHDVRDYDSILINCMSNNRGFSLTSNVALLKSEQSTIETNFKEDERVRVSFVIEPTNQNRLIYTYINGILSGLVQYKENDDFSQSNPINITIGSKDATIDIYNIRIYNINLDHTELLNNYIADLNNISKQRPLYYFNDIFDSYGNINYNKVLQNIPCLTIIGTLPGSKGDKKIVNLNYTNKQNSSKNFTENSVVIDVQGTSSQYYPRKNYKFELNTPYTLIDGYIPEKIFCIKADYMESSHSHNTGLAKIVNKVYPTTPAKELNNKVQSAIIGFPIVVWHKLTETSEPFCLGVYNFNNDKDATTCMGFTADFPNCECWEFRNNTSEHCRFLDDNFTNKEEVAKNFESRYPKKYTNYTALSRVISWVKSTQDNINKFKNEFNNYFNLESTLLYYCLTELFGMVDSRAKNLFLTTWDGQIWYPTFYDMDTSFGLNNEGVNDFDYSVEYHDIKGSQNVFNGEDSVLWNNFETAFQDEITEFYVSLRNDKKITYENVMDVLYGEQISKISENNYNYDAIEKYRNPLVEDNESEYLYAAQGSRLEHLKWWLYNRLRYIDSKYINNDYGVDDFKKDFMTLRIYTPDNYGSVTPNSDLHITPYTDQYVVVKYDENYLYYRAKHDEKVIVDSPNQRFNDTPCIIYGAKSISDIGDLSPLYPGTVDVSSGIKLKKLIIGNKASDYSNTNLLNLSIGNNNLLTLLDVRNCPSLTATIDVSGCTNIEEVYATGTSTTQVALPNGGNVKILHLPQTVTNITILNQLFITDYKCDGYSNLTTLRIENSSVNSLEIVKAALNNLEKVRLLNVDWVIDNKEILEKLMTCRGVDENDENVSKSILTGKIHIRNTVGQDLLDRCSNYYGNQLTVTADYIKPSYLCEFLDYDNTLLYSTYVDENEYAEYKGETPRRESDEEYSYEFNGWRPNNQITPITNNTQFVAQYSQNQFVNVQWLNYDGTLLQENKVRVGEIVKYTSPVPMRPNDNQYKDYVFYGWIDSDGKNYNKYADVKANNNMTLTALYSKSLQTYTAYWYNGNNLIGTSSVEYGSTAIYTGATPTKPKDGEYSYVFSHWLPEISTTKIYEDTNFYAQFNSTPLLIVEWKNYDGSIIQTDKVQHGDTVSFVGILPSRPDDKEYKNYNLISWVGSDTQEYGLSDEIVITKNYTLTAKYTGTKQKYTVNWYNENELLGTSELEYGTIPEYLGDTPTKENNYITQERYEFRGWEPNPVHIESNVDFHAQYHTIKYYEVIFKNWDGTILQTVNVDSGGTAIYTGLTPTRPADDFVYTFNGWDKSLTNIKSNLIVIAVYESTQPDVSIAFNLTDDTLLQPTICTTGNKGTFTIDWGDNTNDTFTIDSTSSTVNLTKSVPYSSTGLKEINITYVSTGNYSPKFYISDEYKPFLNKLIFKDTFKGLLRIEDSQYKNITNLTKVILPDSVTAIKQYAFAGCSNLEEIRIPSNLGNSLGLEYAAFSGCGIKHLELNLNNPDVFSRSAENIFSGCTQLETVVINGNTTKIGYSMFRGCTNLKTVTLSNTVKEAYEYAFSGCTSLENIDFIQNFTSLGDSAFYGCTSLTSVTIPSSITSNLKRTFISCTNLKTVIISQGCTSTLMNTFEKCTNLESIEIPNSVIIRYSTFYNCTSLTSVTIPGNITTIESNTFYNCTSLTSVNIPEGVTSIGESAFYNCTSLTSVNIPEGVTTIGNNAFYDCTSLKYLEIPESVTSIGRIALDIANSSDKGVIRFKSFNPSLITIHEHAFGISFTYNLTIKDIQVPMNALEDYKTTTNFSQHASIITGYTE